MTTINLRGAWVLMATLALMSATAANATANATHAAGHPNILLIVADDLGFSDLGCYGGEIRTPNLDALAAAGVRMTRFYNTGRCCPSRASILTGHYPHRVGLGHMVKNLGRPGYTGRLAPEARTIAQRLAPAPAPAAYRSFICGKWHLGTDDPTDHGFEEFYGTLISAKTFWDPAQFIRRPEGRKAPVYAEGEFYATDAITDHALEFINLARRTPDRPWFLYLAYHAPHFPLHAPTQDIERYAQRYQAGWDAIRAERHQRMQKLGIIPPHTPLTARSPYWDWEAAHGEPNPAWDTLPAARRADLARRMAVYAAMIDRMDQNIGRLVADLRHRGELHNTLIIFISDNGACAEWNPAGFDGASGPDNILHEGPALEQMGSPGTYHSVGSGWANASNTPWRLYKHYNHEGGIASPAIIHWPAQLTRAGTINHQPAHAIDLLPTFLEVAGSDAPDLPGRSLLPVLRGEASQPRPLFFEHEGHRAVHHGQWKLVALRQEPWELYDMRDDRAETRNLAAEHPRVVKNLAQQWEQWARANHVTPMPRDYQVGYLPPASEATKQ